MVILQNARLVPIANRRSVPMLLLVALLGYAPHIRSQSIEVTAVEANVRSEAATTSRVIIRATRGTRFPVLSRMGSWYQVELPSDLDVGTTTGYLHRSTVSEINDIPTVGPGDSPAPREPVVGPAPPDQYGPSREIDIVERQRGWGDRQWREYDQYKKSEFAAAGLEWVIPMLGYAYVDKATAGLTPALVSLGGLTVMFVGVHSGDPGGNAALFWGGFVGYVGGRIWGIVNALEYADSYNRELVRRISIHESESDLEVVMTPHRDGWLVGLRLAR